MNIIHVNTLSNEDEESLTTLIEKIGWNEKQIQGQLSSISKLISDNESIVFFAIENKQIIGFITCQYYRWNRLGQIHGLVVESKFGRNNVASLLIVEIEDFLKSKNARGVYVDTPIDNETGKKFYKSNNFKEAYIMPEYYDVGKDGVTFLKIF